MKKKLYTTIILGFTTFAAVFTSSMYSTALFSISAAYHVSPEASTLGLTLYGKDARLAPHNHC